jgi:hypothetical protein
VPRKLVRTRVAHEPGFIDFVDPDGDVSRVRAPGDGSARPRKLIRLGVRLEAGYLYFIDRDGDVSRALLAHPDVRPQDA